MDNPQSMRIGGSFTCAIGSKETKYFSFINFKRDFIDSNKITKSFGKFFCFYNGFLAY